MNRSDIEVDVLDRQDLLVADAIDLGVHRPQHLMPRNNIRHSSLQSRHIQRT
ncbi:hypothetical protein BKP42_68410 [Rhodococcus erythropolis]|nr:hypothetical protein BKP42_68410 [Rhodococcus erythropolis]